MSSAPSKRVRSCRVCGCTENRACPGGCSWVEADLCSACHPETRARHAAIRRQAAYVVAQLAFALPPVAELVDRPGLLDVRDAFGVDPFEDPVALLDDALASARAAMIGIMDLAGDRLPDGLRRVRELLDPQGEATDA